ncbi:MAG: hypothetical protein K2Y32_22395 [Candidatus Obscuribacterales bacterium]|nr:hypothetical protein [Candidatus Obscuribacterales bacterium]
MINKSVKTKSVWQRPLSRTLGQSFLALFLACLNGSGVAAKDKQDIDRNQAGAEEECLVLRQQDVKVGKLCVYLGRDHVRVDAMNDSCTIVAQSPSWNVVAYNRDGQYFKIDRMLWHEKGMGDLVRSKRIFFDFKSGEPEKTVFLGHSAWKVSRPSLGGFSSSVDIAFRTKEGRGELPSALSRCKTTYVASSDFKLTKPVCEFVEGLYLTQPQARVYLSAILTGPGVGRVDFKTMAIEHRRVPVKFFAVPGGLKPAYSLSAVATGSAVEQILIDAAGGDEK